MAGLGRVAQWESACFTRKRSEVQNLPRPPHNSVVLAISLQKGFLVGWAILMLVVGIAYMFAPERMLRLNYRWNDRAWRWITFGRVRRTPGPKLMRDETAIRVMPFVGAIAAFAGAMTLLWLLVAAFD